MGVNIMSSGSTGSLEYYDMASLDPAEVIVETERAVYISYEGVDSWIAKSLLEDWPNEGESGEVLIARWVAQKKGWIE
jgi:hypothetical protein